jgi:hypothetical protein
MGKFNTQRRCPKCGGNLYMEKDYYGWYEECLQCAFVQDMRKIYENKNAPAASTQSKESL